MTRFVFGALLIVAAMTVTWATALRLGSHQAAVAASWYAGGVLGGLTTYHVAARWHWVAFADTLAHELAHALAALVSGGSITTLHVTARDGGHVQGSYRWTSFVSLAPYCTPFVAALAAITVGVAAVPPGAVPNAVGLGLAFGLHLGSTIQQVRTCAAMGWHGTDFGAVGVPFALLAVMCVNLGLLQLCGAYAVGGITAVGELSRAAGAVALGCIRSLSRAHGLN